MSDKDKIELSAIENASRPSLIRHCVAYGEDMAKMQQISVPDLHRRAAELARGTQPERPAEPPTSPQGSGSKLDAIVGALADDIVPRVERRVREGLQKEFAAALDNRPRETRLTVALPDRSVILPEGQFRHEKYEFALTCLLAGTPIYLHGPAGSGKTTAAKQLAEAIAKIHELESFTAHCQSFSEVSQPHELFGVPAIGNREAQLTGLYDAWRNGGVWLGDEMDAAPSLIIALNAGLGEGKGKLTFANGETVTRHDHCYVMAAGNTNMTGATAEYTSRQRIDRATIDRFVFIEWGYDEKLELAMVGSAPTAQKWTKHVQKYRKALASLGASAPDLLISPRASINGSRLLAVAPDTDWQTLDETVVFKGLSLDDVTKLRTAYQKIK